MTQSLYISLAGEPSRVTHQSGTRISRGHTYKSKALLQWESTLEEGLKQYVPKIPLKGPIRLDVSWEFKAKTKKQNNTWKITRPDTDNMQKTLKDVMTKLGFWKDDSQVVYEVCEKYWGKEPGIFIAIEELEERGKDDGI